MISIMDEIKNIVENYEMGLISAHDLCNQMMTVLSFVGADGALANQIDIELTPLARFLVSNFKSQNRERIEHFQQVKKAYI